MLANIDYIEQQTEALRNATGAADRMAATMNDTAIQAIRNAQSAWKGLTIAITESSGVGDAIGTAFQALADTLNLINDNLEYIGRGVKVLLAPVRLLARAINAVQAAWIAAEVFFVRVHQTLNDIGATFGQVFTYEIILLVRSIAKAFAALPDLLVRPVLAAGAAMVAAFREAGVLAREAFFRGIRGVFGLKDIDDLVRRVSDAATAAARGVISDTTFLTPLADAIDAYADRVVEKLGLQEIADAYAEGGTLAAEAWYRNFTAEYLRFPNVAPPSVLNPRVAPAAVVDPDTITPPGADGITPDHEAAVQRVATITELLAAHSAEYERNLADAFQQATLSTKEYERWRYIQDGVNRLLGEGLELTEAEIARARELLGARYDLLAPLQDAIDRQERLNELTGELSEGFADFARGVLVRFESIGDAAEALGQRIYAALVENLIISPLLGLIDPLIGGVLGTAIPARRHGGYTGRGLTAVGEDGIEIVDFNRPGRVYSNDQLRAALGGGSGGGNQFVYAPVIQTADAGAVSQALRLAYPEWESRTKAAILADGQRPSRMRSAFRGR